MATRYAKTKALGDQLGINEVIAEQTPEQKLQKITELTAMLTHSHGR